MSAITDVKAIQRILGTVPDGIAGEKTEAAWDDLVGRATRERQGGATASVIKVCVDAGHGLSNRSPGVYDPGCVHGALEEAEICLTWAAALAGALAARSVATFLTRPTKETSAPVGTRDDRAKAAGCTHLISIHVNDADSAQAHGTETLYRDDQYFAGRVHSAAADGLKLTNRGLKHRTDLAVLNFPKSCLLELGFIQSAADRERFLDAAVRKETCRLIAASLG